MTTKSLNNAKTNDNNSFQKKAAKAAFFQPKLTINQPNDVYEQEADHMADKVMRMPDPAVNQDAFFKPANMHVQRKCQACEEEEKHVHRKENSSNEVQADSGLHNYVSSLSSSGRQMSQASRSFFEPRFGHDFSNVKVHTDSIAAKSAQSINALAYTTGNNIVFNSGQYSPDTDSGKRLMAHELTHVIQQRNHIGPKLIQKLDCDLKHLDTECGNAQASCHKADAYCASTYPKPSDIDGLFTRITNDANDKGKKYPLASKNLLHYLDNTGSPLAMPSSAFANEPATKDKLKNEHRKKFIDGATARLNDGRLTPGGTADMVWTGTANAFGAFDDMAIAVGGYTLCSKVTVQAVAQGGNSYKITFQSWSVQGFDCYNWDPGKGIGVTGASDNDLCCLENNNKAKHFRVQCDPWDNKDPDSTKEEVVTANPPAPSNPSNPANPPSNPAPQQPGQPSAWDRFTKWLRS